MSTQDYSEHQRLTEAIQMRKRADEDARLLSNRIALLKQEEQKAMKKIEETHRKAQEIIEARNRNLREEQKRENLKKMREEQETIKIEQSRLNRERTKNIKQQANQYKFDQVMQEIKSLKVNKKNNMKTIEFRKFEDLSQKLLAKNKIKEQQREAEEKRKKFFQIKAEKARIDNLKKAENENAKRKIKEEQVLKLEQLEMELIQRLQNTQILQKTAYEDLESALSGQIS